MNAAHSAMANRANPLARIAGPALPTQRTQAVGTPHHLVKPTPAKLPPPAHPVLRHEKPKGFLARHKWSASGVAALFVVAASGVVATLLVREDIATTPSAVAPHVKFLSGTDYATINAAGFATLTIGSSGASATLALNGVAGAALTSLTNLAKIQNTDTSAYTIGFARSAALNAAITDFTITVKNGGTTILTWNAQSAASSSTFSLPASTTYDINIQLSVADGTAAGSLGSFTMQVSIT